MIETKIGRLKNIVLYAFKYFTMDTAVNHGPYCTTKACNDNYMMYTHFPKLAENIFLNEELTGCMHSRCCYIIDKIVLSYADL